MLELEAGVNFSQPTFPDFCAPVYSLMMVIELSSSTAQRQRPPIVSPALC